MSTSVGEIEHGSGRANTIYSRGVIVYQGFEPSPPIETHKAKRVSKPPLLQMQVIQGHQLATPIQQQTLLSRDQTAKAEDPIPLIRLGRHANQERHFAPLEPVTVR